MAGFLFAVVSLGLGVAVPIGVFSWAWSLSRRTDAPRAARWLPRVVGVAVVANFVTACLAFLSASSGDASTPVDRATNLGRGIAVAINCYAFGIAALGVVGLGLCGLALTWRPRP